MNVIVPPAPAARLANATLKAAETATEQVYEEIQDFQRTLGEHEEAWFSMMGAGGGLLIQPHQIRPLGIDKLVIDGVDQNGRRVRAIQHVSQVNIALVAVPAETPNRVGFG